MAGSAESYKDVVGSPTQWHASLKPVAGWTKENSSAFAWSSPVLIGRPDASHTLFLFERDGQLLETTSGSHPLLNEAEFLNVLAEHNRIWLITDNGGYQGGATRNGRFVFPPPDFQLVYEGYGCGVYFRSGSP